MKARRAAFQAGHLADRPAQRPAQRLGIMARRAQRRDQHGDHLPGISPAGRTPGLRTARSHRCSFDSPPRGPSVDGRAVDPTGEQLSAAPPRASSATGQGQAGVGAGRVWRGAAASSAMGSAGQPPRRGGDTALPVSRPLRGRAPSPAEMCSTRAEAEVAAGSARPRRRRAPGAGAVEQIDVPRSVVRQAVVEDAEIHVEEKPCRARSTSRMRRPPTCACRAISRGR